MKNSDLYEKVTAHIVEALESGAADPNGWHAPWHAAAASMPTNVRSKKAYRGVNTLVLWSEQVLKGYPHAVWGTYKQWTEAGAQVRKGETSTKVLLWKPATHKHKDADGNDEQSKYLLAREYSVFNVAQVDGYAMPAVEETTPLERSEHADAFFAALGADVHHGGNRAYYTSAADRIQLPPVDSFEDVESYYATSAHEHVHWTGHESRLSRDLKNRFGSASYAAEELVAEIGAAYVCALLGISSEPRPDHAHYVANWITLLKDDPQAIVTAASKAQAAADWITEHAVVQEKGVEVAA